MVREAWDFGDAVGSACVAPMKAHEHKSLGMADEARDHLESNGRIAYAVRTLSYSGQIVSSPSGNAIWLLSCWKPDNMSDLSLAIVALSFRASSRFQLVT